MVLKRICRRDPVFDMGLCGRPFTDIKLDHQRGHLA